MTAIARRSIRAHIPALVTLAPADDLDGDQSTHDVTGVQRVIIASYIGTPGTAGIDVIQVSHDGGATWKTDDTLMLASADDNTGNIVAGAALEAAGVEPITGPTAIWKAGPYEGPTLMRLVRDTDDAQPATSADWVTGAPGVFAVLVY